MKINFKKTHTLIISINDVGKPMFNVNNIGLPKIETKSDI